MLDEVSPLAFEEWCKVVLERHYNCKVEVTRAVGDEGRDLLVHHDMGLIVAECKHYQRAKVGRPVVQKLHSAIITAGSSHGLILTTGTFTPEAYEYVTRLRETIELIDGTKLAVMAQAVGVPMTWAGGGSIAIPTTADRDFPRMVEATILSPDRYRPVEGKRPHITVSRKTRYDGFFVSEYRASGRTNTAVGSHGAAWEGTCWLSADGRTWANGPVPGLREDFPQPIDMAIVSREAPGDVDVPAVQLTDALQRMRDGLSRSLVEHVSYTGRNNVGYTKEIKPGKRAIQLDATALVYLPRQRFRITGLAEAFEGDIIETKDEFIITCAELVNCATCGGVVTPRTQRICAVCNRVTHQGWWARPESFVCTKCNAIVCPRHTRAATKQRYCPSCAPFDSKRPLHRLIVPVSVGIAVSMVAVIHGELSNWMYQSWNVLGGLGGWIPAVVRAWPVGFRKKGEAIRYRKAPLNASSVGAPPGREDSWVPVPARQPNA